MTRAVMLAANLLFCWRGWIHSAHPHCFLYTVFSTSFLLSPEKYTCCLKVCLHQPGQTNLIWECWLKPIIDAVILEAKISLLYSPERTVTFFSPSSPNFSLQVEQGIRTVHRSAMNPSCLWRTPRRTWMTGSRPYGGSSGRRLEEVKPGPLEPKHSFF